ncbi:MAG: Uma2 family endonuclease [Acidobacteria bacterium]|nr:Uma2 family endonuclease [Acidobacteriota bacterium]
MSTKYQTLDHPLPPKETLPTMEDLPSEQIGDPGVPDFFHLWQPRLLEDTFQSPVYAPEEICIAADVNLYFNVHNTGQCKRPDWFVAVGVKNGRKLRDSYVIWQEGTAPMIIVEFLSESTKDEDLGKSRPRKLGESPSKWEVYEQILRVPYYVLFSRHTDELKILKLSGTRYEEVLNHQGRFWFEEIELGLGLWEGSYHDNHRLWLRWYDKSGHWIPHLDERLEQERREKESALRRAEQAEQKAIEAEQKAARLAELLRQLGQDPDQI